MGDILGGLRQVPLQVTGEPRAVVDDAEQQGRLPFTLRGQNLPRAVMEIPMPELIDILGFVAADLSVG